MDMKNWVKEIIFSKKKKAMPILSFPSTSLMGIEVKELINSSELQAKGMTLVAEKNKWLASVSYMDLSVEAECFGSTIRVFDDEVPAVIGEIVHDEDEANALEVPSVYSGRTKHYLEAIKIAKENIKDRPIFAGIIGSYSLAGRLVGVEDSMIYCYTEPDMLKIVLEKATEFLINYAKEYKKMGADGIVIAEPLTGLLSPDLAEEFSNPYIKKIIDAVSSEDFAVIYHNCGTSVGFMVDGIYKLGADGYHFGNAVDLRTIVDRCPKDKLFMGNIDPSSQFFNGTVESIKTETSKLLNDLSGYDNFVISSGCDLPPLSKWENIQGFFDATEEFYNK